MNALVTGGAGFIGSHVAKHCRDAGMSVVALDDLSAGFRDHAPEGVHFVEGSVTDAVLVNCLFDKYRFDYIYHLAAYAAEGLSHFVRTFNYTNNLLGSVNLINAAVRYEVKCFVFASSTAVYGAGQVPSEEAMVPHPADPYGISKYAVEMDLKAARAVFGLNHVIFRPHNVYGVNQNIGDRYRNVIGIFMSQILRGEPMTIFGDGRQTRAFSYVDDVAPYIAQCVNTTDAYNEVINIGADTPCCVNDIATAVACALQVVPRIRHLPARNEVRHAYASHEKAKRIFAINGCVSLEEGVDRMARWARTVGTRKSGGLHHFELTRNLPATWME